MNTVLITGANRGLGLGFVKYYLSLGYLVFAGTRKLDKLPSDIVSNKNLHFLEMDVTSDESINSAVKTIEQYTTKLDILINNAGVSKDTVGANKQLVNNIQELDRKTLLKMFDVNTVSPFIVVKNTIQLLSKSSMAFIINVSSARASYNDEWDKKGYNTPNYGYRGSKAALSIMTYALKNELPENVKAFSVDPGDVHTDMNTNGDQDPMETAKQIMKIIKNWKSEYNGEFMRYSGEPYPK